MRRFILTAVAAGVFLAGYGWSAEPGAAQRATIRQRQINQQRRIAQGIHSGELTAREAARLERKEARLNREIRRDRADGGALTLKERRKIGRQQDRLSRQIYREKHDNQQARPWN